MSLLTTFEMAAFLLLELLPCCITQPTCYRGPLWILHKTIAVKCEQSLLTRAVNETYVSAASKLPAIHFRPILTHGRLQICVKVKLPLTLETAQ